MSDVIIHARDLRKVYRLYSSPRQRFLDMFGLLGNRPGAFTEHAALDGINLDIRRGEKVAFIGRNGAGKSTLLKLITHVIEPTSGELQVSGKAHALLQIGSGFHPDFTGRENVYAYLAQLGVTGREADRKFADIVEFAELEEYISQPLKTYSTGMSVRLMFSTSTAITPDLLVLDEVLGVGDAYFAHKSYNRMHELCDSAGTTLLLVTHDIYSAVKLCDRVVWIDRGRVLMDGNGPDVVTAYEDSVRQQEEQRLRRKNEERLKGLTAAPRASAAPAVQHVVLEIFAKNNVPQPCPLYLSEVSLAWGSEATSWPLSAEDGGPQTDSHLVLDSTAWGAPVTWHERLARPFLNYGSPFHKVAGVFRIPEGRTVDRAQLRIAYWSDEPVEVGIRYSSNGTERLLGALPETTADWATHTVSLDADTSREIDPTAALSLEGRQGTGAIVVGEVRTVDSDGRDVHLFRHGDPFTLLISYQINQPGLSENAQVLVAIHRDGVLDTCRLITRDLHFDHARAAAGTIRLHLPRLFLANGTFTVTVMVAREGYYDRTQTKYFSLNPEVYTCLSRVTEIVVSDGGIVASGTGVVGEGEWSLVQ